jgi:RHS repeat-associated protein
VIASYRYDALGRRVEKNVGGTVARHVLSISNELEHDVGKELNDCDRRADISNVVAVYDGSDFWKQNFVWSDEADGIVMLEQGDVLDYDTDSDTAELTRSFYHRNALGSVMAITDMNEAEVVSYRYDPYGKVTITRGGTPQSSDPLGNHWTFTGRFLDEEAGLYYYRARYYDPATGRFLQRDPLGYSLLGWRDWLPDIQPEDLWGLVPRKYRWLWDRLKDLWDWLNRPPPPPWWWFDPWAPREPEPLGGSANSGGDGPNLFQYGSSNPATMVDPSGLQEERKEVTKNLDKDGDIQAYGTAGSTEGGGYYVEGGIKVTPKGAKKIVRGAVKVITFIPRKIFQGIKSIFS